VRKNRRHPLDNIGEFRRRLKARLGKAGGIVATAHSRAEPDSQPAGCHARVSALVRREATSPASSTA